MIHSRDAADAAAVEPGRKQVKSAGHHETGRPQVDTRITCFCFFFAAVLQCHRGTEDSAVASHALGRPHIENHVRVEGGNIGECKWACVLHACRHACARRCVPLPVHLCRSRVFSLYMFAVVSVVLGCIRCACIITRRQQQIRGCESLISALPR